MNWAYFSLVLSRVKIFVPSSGQIMQDTFWHSPLHRHIYGFSLPLSHLSFFVVTPSGGRFRQVNTTSADNSDWSVQTFVITSWRCDFPALWYESFMASLEWLAPPWGTIRVQLGMSHISFHNDDFQKGAGQETLSSLREVGIVGPYGPSSNHLLGALSPDWLLNLLSARV